MCVVMVTLYSPSPVWKWSVIKWLMSREDFVFIVRIVYIYLPQVSVISLYLLDEYIIYT